MITHDIVQYVLIVRNIMIITLIQDASHYLKSSWISNELKPLLNSLRLAIETAAQTRNGIISDVRAISVGLGATAVAVALLVIGVVICVRSGVATRHRMNNAIMALVQETNMRPVAEQPAFRI